MALKELKFHASPTATKTIIFLNPLEPREEISLRAFPDNAKTLAATLYESLPAMTFGIFAKEIAKYHAEFRRGK